MGLYRGGRKPGTKNKRTDLFSLCDEKKINVFSEMLDMAMNEQDPDKKFRKFKDLAEYLYFKPKDPGDVNLTPEQVREMIKEWTRDANANQAASG